MQNAQGGSDPKGSQVDYKAFFDKYIEGKRSEKAKLEAAISPKMSESEKFAIEKQIFSIEREMFKMEANPAPEINMVEQRIKDLKLPAHQEKYLLDAASNVKDQSEATALVDFIGTFTGIKADPTLPADITSNPSEAEGKATPVAFSASEIINPATKDIAKANIAQLVSELSAK